MKAQFKASPERVYALLTDAQFLVDRCLAVGELEVDCDIEEHDDLTEIKLSRLVSRDLPGFISKLFDSRQTLKMREEWQQDSDDSWSGSYVINVQNQPVTITADFQLCSADDGCCYTIEHKVKSKVPLIGGRISKYILAETRRGCAAELEYLREQL